MLTDVSNVVLGVDEFHNPPYQAVDGQQTNHDHPEPHEQENLLVEDIMWQRALNRVALNIATHATQFEVAHSDPRESRRCHPISARNQMLHHVNTVE